jgi:hypothetical protein
MTLPEGLTVKQADVCASKTLRLNDAISFDRSGQYTALGKCDYSDAGA